jgi:hypothetical protein
VGVSLGHVHSMHKGKMSANDSILNCTCMRQQTCSPIIVCAVCSSRLPAAVKEGHAMHLQLLSQVAPSPLVVATWPGELISLRQWGPG